MNKRIYILIGIIVGIVLIGGGIVWYFEKKSAAPGQVEKPFSPSEQKVVSEEGKNVSEGSPEAVISQPAQPSEVSELENFESELNSDIESLSGDLDELNSVAEDASLNDLDSSLSGLSE